MRKLTVMSLVVGLMVALVATPVVAKVITGTNKGDLLKGSPQEDEIRGLGGSDLIEGWAGDDEIFGGPWG